jgi:lauroyl/myristoyl acyltransferase
MSARDFLLDAQSDGDVDRRFHTEGFEHIVDALGRGDGLIVLGSHLGAYIPALHWLYRQDLPLRAMIQRPRHVSSYLQDQLDRADEPYPSTSLFLRRDLSRRDAAERILRGRGALREGLALYLCGDITTPAGPSVSWFGHRARLLDHWIHLAASTGAWVVPLFATFAPRGTYSLRFERPLRVSSRRPDEALAHYLNLLQHAVADDPAQAVPYWTWPSYDFLAVHSLMWARSSGAAELSSRGLPPDDPAEVPGAVDGERLPIG